MMLSGLIKPKIEVEMWATPNPDLNLSLDEFAKYMKDKGYNILDIDTDNNRVLLIKEKKEG